MFRSRFGSLDPTHKQNQSYKTFLVKIYSLLCKLDRFIIVHYFCHYTKMVLLAMRVSTLTSHFLYRNGSWLKRLARYKRSSLFGLYNIGKEKAFITLSPVFNFIRIFYTNLYSSNISWSNVYCMHAPMQCL